MPITCWNEFVDSSEIRVRDVKSLYGYRVKGSIV